MLRDAHLALHVRVILDEAKVGRAERSESEEVLVRHRNLLLNQTV